MDCRRDIHARELCMKHYRQLRRTGSPVSSRIRRRYGPDWIEEYSTVDPETECWTWTGPTNGKGYGRCSNNGTYGYAHRFAYEEHRAPIPYDCTIDHLCGNHSCVNPAQMEPVSLGENIRRGSGPHFDLYGRHW